MPAIIGFLGYNPLPAANTLAEQLVRQRTKLGLSQKESARELAVDQGTLAKWEQGKAGRSILRVPYQAIRNVNAADRPRTLMPVPLP